LVFLIVILELDEVQHRGSINLFSGFPIKPRMTNCEK